LIKLTDILLEVLKENQNININLNDADEWDFSEPDEIMFVYDVELLNIDPNKWGDNRIKFSIPVQTVKDLLYNQSRNQEKVFLDVYGIDDKNSNWVAILDKDTASSIMDSYYENYPNERPFELNEKKLCPKGRAYYNRRIAAGEKPSAYLSGRAVKVCKGLMSEDIDPSEAYTDVDAITTLADKKRDIAFIVKKSNTPENWERVLEVIQNNNIELLRVKGNPYEAYVAYLPKSKEKALKLKALAEKYNGYLASNATAEDTREIGRLLGYKEDKVEEYIAKRNIDESLRDWFQKEDWVRIDTQGNITGPCGTMKKGGDDPYLCHKCGHDNNYKYNDNLEEAKQVGTLYHWTSLKSLANIIKTNTILPSHSGHGEYDWVSLTRSKDKNQFGIAEAADCVIVLDGDKLSNKYKIEPYHDVETGEYDELTYFDDNGNAIGTIDDDGNIIRYGAFDEMEERLFGLIRNLDKYIIKVILYKSNPEVESLLKEKNIPYELNLNESLRDWFKKEDWVRIDTTGNITGPCGTMKKGKATTRCLPRAKANRLTKDERAATARKKVAGSKKGKQFVPNTEKAKVKLNK